MQEGKKETAAGIQSKKKNLLCEIFFFKAPRFISISPSRKKSNICSPWRRWTSRLPHVCCDFRVKNHQTPSGSTLPGSCKHTCRVSHGRLHIKEPGFHYHRSFIEKEEKTTGSFRYLTICKTATLLGKRRRWVGGG